MRFFLIFIILLANASHAGSNEKNSYIIGVENYNRFPYEYIKDGEYKGLFRDILDKFADDSGIEFKYVPYKIKDIYANFFADKFDFKFPDNPVWMSPQKSNYKITYSNYITHYIDGIFIKKDDLGKTVNQLENFGVMKEPIIWTLANKQNRGKIKVKIRSSCSELIDMLEKKEINAIFCNYDVMKYLLKKSTLEDKILINLDLPFIDNYFHVSTIQYPNILKKLDEWILNNRNFIDEKIHEYK